MLSVIRNLFVTVAGFVAAFLATASVQAALDFGLPVLSVRSIAGTNVSTLVMLASLAIFFFAMAYLAPAWIWSICFMCGIMLASSRRRDDAMPTKLGRGPEARARTIRTIKVIHDR
jgi:hypothetical protein